ncbi:YHS domain-containing (seleno)protein [Aestuariivita boseongensis]|uniref:YHS domain-containing (seleno)protein n=1 Tax=Aestuariivita boseongensis TaxID=1470562 RepID=UPI0006814152|nr:YHS domain-containing (seleno)protein [Aestuariivita boseongensis]
MLSRRLFLASGAALAAAGPVRADQPMFFAREGAVIGGIDVVAYFTEGRPVKGSRDHAVMWKGAVFYFASAANRTRFEMNPMRYAPQYGGYCAYAVARGYTAPVVPEAWQIVDGKLYLCYSLRVLELWQRDIPGFIARGDANWPQVLQA